MFFILFCVTKVICQDLWQVKEVPVLLADANANWSAVVPGELMLLSSCFIFRLKSNIYMILILVVMNDSLSILVLFCAFHFKTVSMRLGILPIVLHSRNLSSYINILRKYPISPRSMKDQLIFLGLEKVARTLYDSHFVH